MLFRSEQRDWDQYAERLAFALNTSEDGTRGDTPHYLVHGWDPRTTVEAMIGVSASDNSDPDARRWRRAIQRWQVGSILREAMEARAEQANMRITPFRGIGVGSRVWVFIE